MLGGRECTDDEVRMLFQEIDLIERLSNGCSSNLSRLASFTTVRFGATKLMLFTYLKRGRCFNQDIPYNE